MADDAREPFVDGYLAYLLARASHLVSGEFHRQVEAAGLSVAEWRVLATLADRSGCPVGELAQITLNKQPTLTKLLDRMAAEGLVERRSGETDRRTALVWITAAGRARARPLLAKAAAHERAVLEDFGTQQGQQLKDTLRRLIALHTGR
ncbi:MarR family transcriptional regulator [Cupriavidus sp. USMAA2-4]|uniref:MarR family transcriptional regulator n=1 Tax=Cupriavidus malaysiensis TaxID=367825 RepID=A0ABM6F6Z3_9BURK|nr:MULTISPECIES: MarR family winged helix-turn-helix transcriptional regulator [Cupriavidus]AOY93194.1 MarR family transcriptional regulator [Cupriavidus sp. USMAA2-4]AOZ00515.1 MarR family transcriptional regulator [Cupriavidus sp. USMAHM13]AOZ07262.1 MarR family transcriptional regulator [Cupriavidus malaysiensis]